MPTTDELINRQEALEELLVEFLELFQSQLEGNSTFEGGHTILDVEVDDPTEDLITRAEILVENSPLDFDSEGD